MKGNSPAPVPPEFAIPSDSFGSSRDASLRILEDASFVDGADPSRDSTVRGGDVVHPARIKPAQQSQSSTRDARIIGAIVHRSANSEWAGQGQPTHFARARACP